MKNLIQPETETGVSFYTILYYCKERTKYAQKQPAKHLSTQNIVHTHKKFKNMATKGF